MPNTDPCTICQLAAQPTREGSTRDFFRTRCARCGDFEWDPRTPFDRRADRVVKMAGFVREQNAVGIVPRFTSELVRTVERMPMPRLRDRAMRLLATVVEKLGHNLEAVHGFDDEPSMLAVSYSANLAELDVLFSILDSERLFRRTRPVSGSLTAAGCMAAEDLAQPRTTSAQGFVAMSFDRSMDEAYTLGFDRGIRLAGYRPLRIDGHEHAGPISDAIMAEIRRSRFVVADYTKMNNGVYFEAGFAVGLGVPVIGTCHADDFGRLHFDIRHINTLRWETPADLAEGLARRISAVVGDGPLPRP